MRTLSLAAVTIGMCLASCGSEYHRQEQVEEPDAQVEPDFDTGPDGDADTDADSDTDTDADTDTNTGSAVGCTINGTHYE